MKIKIPAIYPIFIEKENEILNRKYLFQDIEKIDFEIKEIEENSEQTIATIFFDPEQPNEHKIHNFSCLSFSSEKQLGKDKSKKILNKCFDNIKKMDFKKINNKYFFKCYDLEYKYIKETIFENNNLIEKESETSILKPINKENIEKYLNNLHSPIQSKINLKKVCFDLENPYENNFIENKINSSLEVDDIFENPINFKYKDVRFNFLQQKNIENLEIQIDNIKTKNKKKIINNKDKTISLYQELQNEFLIINDELWCSNELPIIYKRNILFNNSNLSLEKILPYENNNIKFKTKIFENDIRNDIINKNLTIKATEISFVILKTFFKKMIGIDRLIIELEKQDGITILKNNLINQKELKKDLLKLTSKIFQNDNEEIIKIVEKIKNTFFNSLFVNIHMNNFYFKSINNKDLINYIEQKTKNILSDDVKKILDKKEIKDEIQNIINFNDSDSKLLINILAKFCAYDTFIQKQYKNKDIDFEEVFENNIKF